MNYSDYNNEFGFYSYLIYWCKFMIPTSFILMIIALYDKQVYNSISTNTIFFNIYQSDLPFIHDFLFHFIVLFWSFYLLSIYAKYKLYILIQEC